MVKQAYEKLVISNENEQSFYRNLTVIAREDTYQLHFLEKRLNKFQAEFMVEIALLEKEIYHPLNAKKMKRFIKLLRTI